MYFKILCVLGVSSATLIGLVGTTGCAVESEGEGGETSTSGGSTNLMGTGGAATDTGGAPATDTGGAPATDTGGAPATGTGGAAAGGSNDPGGVGGTAGSGGDASVATGGSEGNPDGGIPLGNDPVLSAGCGKPQGITGGFKTINSEGQDREYVIDIPPDYDPNTPYRFFYVSHWASGNAQSMASNNYYRIKTEANAADEPAIFVAASGIGGFWGEEDHPLFDNILAYVEENLCIDTTRVFAIGYSFGGMISYSLSRNHQDKIRAVVGIAPANWNIWLPETTNQPIPWLQIHGLQDETCHWVNDEAQRRGGKYIVLEKAADNGCDIPGDDDFPVWESGPHFCYEFEGCDAGYPVKICTNNGVHSAAERYTDPGESSSWVPPTAWEFFTRF